MWTYFVKFLWGQPASHRCAFFSFLHYERSFFGHFVSYFNSSRDVFIDIPVLWYVIQWIMHLPMLQVDIGILLEPSLVFFLLLYILYTMQEKRIFLKSKPFESCSSLFMPFKCSQQHCSWTYHCPCVLWLSFVVHSSMSFTLAFNVIMHHIPFTGILLVYFYNLSLFVDRAVNRFFQRCVKTFLFTQLS